MKILTDPKARERLRNAVRKLFAQNGNPAGEGHATPAVRMGRLQAYLMLRFEGFEAVKDQLAHLGVASKQDATRLMKEVSDELAEMGYHENGRF